MACAFPESEGQCEAQLSPAQPVNIGDEELGARVEVFRQRWATADDSVDQSPCCKNIPEDYQFAGLLGSGRYGRTYAVQHRASDDYVAVKVCSFRRLTRSVYDMGGLAEEEQEQEDPEVSVQEIRANVKSVRMEMLFLRCLQDLCPFVVCMTEHGTVCDLNKGELGFSMDLMAGSLHQIWGDWQDLVPEEKREEARGDAHGMIVFIAAQMADALRFLHSCGVAHLDISVANILIMNDGYVKLADFGQAAVETSGPRACAVPQSVAAINARNLTDARSAGPPEVLWVNMVFPEKPEIIINGLTDLHMLGYSLMSLDWPYDLASGAYEKIEYDEDASDLASFLSSYKTLALFSSENPHLEDFIRRLTEPHPSHRLGADNPDDLIRHKLFEDIDFEKLRQGTLPAPMSQELREMFEDGVMFEDVSISNTPWDVDTVEQRFSAGLPMEQKTFFSRVYENNFD